MKRLLLTLLLTILCLPSFAQGTICLNATAGQPTCNDWQVQQAIVATACGNTNYAGVSGLWVHYQVWAQVAYHFHVNLNDTVYYNQFRQSQWTLIRETDSPNRWGSGVSYREQMVLDGSFDAADIFSQLQPSLFCGIDGVQVRYKVIGQLVGMAGTYRQVYAQSAWYDGNTYTFGDFSGGYGYP